MRGSTTIGATLLGLLAFGAPVAGARTNAPHPTDTMSATRAENAGDDDESGASLERRVKAAFLYKFSGYVEWPPAIAAGADSSIVFGVIGDDEIADELSRLVQHRGDGARPVRVVRVRAFEPRPRVHVLFIGRGESDRLGAVIRSTGDEPILVVTDTEGALALGSMINFVTVDGHVRFEVGLGAAKRRGLILSSRLLAVAQSVTRRAP